MRKQFTKLQIKDCLWFSDGRRSYLLMNIKKKGWFLDVRNNPGSPPKVKVIRKALFWELDFEKIKAKKLKL